MSHGKTCTDTTRHKELHASLDELLACFILETGKLPTKTTLMELMEWSNKIANQHLAPPPSSEGPVE